jgi:hypothetical protein
MRNPKSLANLRPPLKKGETLPGGGRKPGPTLTTLVRDFMDMPSKGRTGYQRFLRGIERQLNKANPVVLKLVWDRLDPADQERIKMAVGVKLNQQINVNLSGDIKRLSPAERDEFERLTRKYEGIEDVKDAVVVEADRAGTV